MNKVGSLCSSLFAPSFIPGTDSLLSWLMGIFLPGGSVGKAALLLLDHVWLYIPVLFNVGRITQLSCPVCCGQHGVAALLQPWESGVIAVQWLQWLGTPMSSGSSMAGAWHEMIFKSLPTQTFCGSVIVFPWCLFHSCSFWPEQFGQLKLLGLLASSKCDLKSRSKTLHPLITWPAQILGNLWDLLWPFHGI